MKKRLTAFFTALIAAIQICPMGYAAATGWTLSYKEPDDSALPLNPETEYVDISNEAYTGNHSLYAVFKRNVQRNVTMDVETSVSGLVNGNSYDVEFYLKGTYDLRGVLIGIGLDDNTNNGSLVRLSRNTRYTVQDMENGWKQYKFTVLYDEDNPIFKISFDRGIEELYIDDISVCETGKTENLMNDGGFENSKIKKEGMQTVLSDEYYPKTVVVNERNGMIVVSWRNPSSTRLTDVKLYDITDVPAQIGTTNATASNYNIVKQENLPEGTQKQYKIVCEFSDKKVSEYIVSGKATENKNLFVPLSVAYTDGDDGFFPGSAHIDRENGYTGTGALKIEANQGVWKSGTYMSLVYGVSNLDKNKRYKMTFMAKMLGKTYISMNNAWEAFADGSDAAYIQGEAENQWRQYTYYIEGKTSLNMRFEITMYADILMDSFKLCETDENGADGEIVAEQEFEPETVKINGVESLSAKALRNTAILSWSAPDKAAITRVYMIDPDTERRVQCAEMSAETESVAFEKLSNDIEYLFSVVCESSDGKLSEEKTIHVTPTPLDAEYAKPVIYIGGAKTDVLQQGDITIKAEVKNNKREEGTKAQLAAVVTKDNKLVIKKATDVVNIAKTDYSSTPTVLEVNFELPDLTDGEYEVQAFLFDNLTDLNCLSDYQTWREEN